MSRRAIPVPKPAAILSATAKSVAAARTRGQVAFFQAVAARVPAYKDFLKKNHVAASKIRTIDDLRGVPPVGKKNYLRQYPLEALCWDGDLRKQRITFTSTSGSTGEQFYFPRDAALDFRSSILHELYLRTVSRGKVPSTLVIVTFGMGVWIGGIITYQAFRYLSERGYPVSVITPGTNKQEIFEALRRLAPLYDQVILCGYPPFLKDLLDEAPEHGFDPKKTPLKILYAAEGFSESFREHVMDKSGVKDPFFDTANIYGSADLGTMAIETPLAIALRRAAIESPAIYSALFTSANRLPTLAQFHPSLANFDVHEGQIVVSGDSALPLVRYAIGDHGGVLEYEDAIAVAQATDAKRTAQAIRQAGRSALPLPFVYIYERADFSTKLYGAIIYAEHVKAALQDKSLTRFITGKFTMGTERDKDENEYLDMHVELRRRVKASDKIRHQITEALVEGLQKQNAEYRYLAERVKERVRPQVVLWPHEHHEHFRPGGKQKWIKKKK